MNVMSQTDIAGLETRIAAILIDNLKLEDVTPDTFDRSLNLVEELGIDSMDLTTVVLVLQDEFKVRFDEDDYPKLMTVRAIAEHVRMLQASAA